MNKNCVVCGKEMTNVRSDKKFCSRTCSNKYTWSNRNNKTRTKICLKCNEEFEPKEFGATRRYCFNCIPDTPKNGSQMRRIIKIWALEYLGGECKVCGYNKCINALEFHHINKEKDFEISSRNLVLEWETIKEELDKCIVVCANCHREIHSKEEETNE